MTTPKFRRIVPLLAMVVAQLACAPVADAKPSPSPDKATQIIYVGTRAEGATGGITAARFDPATGTLTRIGKAADVARPTWLLASPQRGLLYSVSEVGNDGKVEASVHGFRADPVTGTLTQISQVKSGGGGATHLAVGGTPRLLGEAREGGAEGHLARRVLQQPHHQYVDRLEQVRGHVAEVGHPGV